MAPSEAASYSDEFRAIGLSAGLEAIGIAPASVMERALGQLHQRQAAGFADSMQFTFRNPVRSTSPRSALPSAQAMLVGARSYLEPPPPRPTGAIGAVARYAWRDHYAELRRNLGEIATRLKADGHKAVVVADDNALVDREAAWLAGLGWFGKNANLLLPGLGSYFVLGAVLTSAALPPTERVLADGCGSCSRCLPACPTQAIVAPGVIDARRCLAWLLQRPGIFHREFRSALGVRIYGCDDCQTACPPTARQERVMLTNGSTAGHDSGAEAWVDLLDMLTADDHTLLERHGRWYIPERNPMWLRRNALIALGNSGWRDPHTAAVLQRYLNDEHPVLRVHAVWAAAALGLTSILPTGDPDADVAEELRLSGVGANR